MKINFNKICEWLTWVNITILNLYLINKIISYILNFIKLKYL